jgi:hypothetical protein
MDPGSHSWIRDRIDRSDGFPRVDWDAVHVEVSGNVPEDRWDETYSTAAREWLQELHASLGEPYVLLESPNFLLVSPHTLSSATNLIRFLERARGEILEHRLPGIAEKYGYGKHAAIVVANLETYQSYIDFFYPEGEFTRSVGVFLPQGYGHFVTYGRELGPIEATLAHELTHVCAMHLQLPAWVNEGLATSVERALAGTAPIEVDAERMSEHLELWSDGAIQTFWSGAAIDDVDRTRAFYHFAELLVRALSSDYPRFREFVRSASWSDGGEAASHTVYGRSLGRLIEQFLGPGAWDPSPESWDAVTDETV